MKKYAKIINEKTKTCSVGVNDDEADFYIKEGYSLQDVEQGYDLNWYISGYAPQKPLSLIYQEELTALKKKLGQSDYIAMKIAEGAAKASDYAEQLAERQNYRKEINRLEDLLAQL